jgi:hypothetical protein
MVRWQSIEHRFTCGINVAVQMSMMIHAVGDHRYAMFRVLSTMNLLERYTTYKQRNAHLSPSLPQGFSEKEPSVRTGNETAGFFCMTVHLHIGCCDQKVPSQV